MAQAQGIEVLSPVGRLVQGSLWELQDQFEDDGKTPKRDEKGEIVKRAYFALAVEKNNPEWLTFWQKLVGVAASGYPQYFNNGNMPGLKDFAWKVTDGDGFDKYGKPNSEKPGFAGCWIVKFSSSFLPRCYEKGKYAKHEQLQDSRAIKLGYFVRVGAIVRPNIGSKTHGLYMNSDLVSLEFVGEEIQFGRDAGAAFSQAAQTGYTPQGAQALPMGGMAGNAGMPGGASMPGSPAGTMQSNPMAGAQGAMPGAGNGGMPGNATMMSGGGNGSAMPGSMNMPGTNVQPNTGFAQGALNPGQQQQGGGFPFNAAPAERPLIATPKANGYTLEQFLANGFTKEKCIEDGFFVYG